MRNVSATGAQDQRLHAETLEGARLAFFLRNPYAANESASSSAIQGGRP